MVQKIVAAMPLLKNVKVVRQWSRLFCNSLDHQPILGTHSQIEGFYMFLSLSGHDFMSVPITGQLIFELILDGKPSIPFDKLGIGRFERVELIHKPTAL